MAVAGMDLVPPSFPAADISVDRQEAVAATAGEHGRSFRSARQIRGPRVPVAWLQVRDAQTDHFGTQSSRVQQRIRNSSITRASGPVKDLSARRKCHQWCAIEFNRLPRRYVRVFNLRMARSLSSRRFSAVDRRNLCPGLIRSPDFPFASEPLLLGGGFGVIEPRPPPLGREESIQTCPCPIPTVELECSERKSSQAGPPVISSMAVGHMPLLVVR